MGEGPSRGKAAQLKSGPGKREREREREREKEKENGGGKGPPWKIHSSRA